MSSQSSIVVVQERAPALIIRALYFVLFGLWFSGIWAAIAWFLCVTIVGLPFGLWMLNRLPHVVTLQPRRGDLMIAGAGQIVSRDVRQRPFLLRALYFVLIGWWFSALWIAVAWVLCATILGMIIGFWMFNRTAAIASFAR
jgi:uncharacterized membrane protein YccF (DUF307 family)